MTDRNLANLIEPLPLAARTAVKSLYGLPLLPKDDLIALVENYAGSIKETAARYNAVNVGLADRIARCCVALLQDQWQEELDHNRRLIQAACLYYVWQEDGISDSQSVSGFDDDAEFLNQVVTHLGRPDLQIDL